MDWSPEFWDPGNDICYLCLRDFAAKTVTSSRKSRVWTWWVVLLEKKVETREMICAHMDDGCEEEEEGCSR